MYEVCRHVKNTYVNRQAKPARIYEKGTSGSRNWETCLQQNLENQNKSLPLWCRWMNLIIIVRVGPAITAIQFSSTITRQSHLILMYLLMPVFLWCENALCRPQERRACLTVFNFLNIYVFLRQKVSEVVYKEKKKP